MCLFAICLFSLGLSVKLLDHVLTGLFAIDFLNISVN
jgi:hypothetical protein